MTARQSVCSNCGGPCSHDSSRCRACDFAARGFRAFSQWEVEMLERMWNNGASAAGIAIALGTGRTRNAVMSMVRRLKLTRTPRGKKPRKKHGDSRRSPHGGGGAADKVASPKRAPAPQRAKAPPSRPAPPPRPVLLRGIALVEIGAAQCRWPLWQMTDDWRSCFPCCGKPCAHGSSYCPAHRAVSGGGGARFVGDTAV